MTQKCLSNDKLLDYLSKFKQQVPETRKTIRSRQINYFAARIIDSAQKKEHVCYSQIIYFDGFDFCSLIISKCAFVPIFPYVLFTHIYMCLCVSVCKQRRINSKQL